MLRRLHIRNYLLIEELDLSLGKELTIITGETGSGKSILIGALGLAMRERAETGAHRDPSKRCIIELEVEIGGLDLKGWFEKNELPYDKNTIIRRQLEPVRERDGGSGRSRAFINDTPVRLDQLRDLGERLVHIHSQHHTLLLNDPRFQLGLIDNVAEQAGEVVAFTANYSLWRALVKELDELKERELKARNELDLFNFQLNELDEASLEEGELERIDHAMARAENASELIKALGVVEEGVNAERGALSILTKLRQTLTKPSKFDPQVNGLLDRISSVAIELQDIAATADDLATKVSMDPEQAALLRERIDRIQSLLQKHRVKSTEELIALREDLRTRTAAIGSLADRISGLTQTEREKQQAIQVDAMALSAVRVAAMAPFAKRVATQLRDLGMPHAKFIFGHAITEQPGPQGVDQIRALFSANADRAPAPLDKVASGGELSRVMLALISLAADSQDLPTVIFDEIDAGVSGEVADRVGTLMSCMGKQRQVLAITHLPQIASKAQNHLLVTKATSENTVLTSISPLTMEQRVEAIAQMLSGRKLTKAALENARVLLKG